MTYIDTIFNTSGKIPTDSNLFEGPIEDFVTEDGITRSAGRVPTKPVMVASPDEIEYLSHTPAE